MSPQKPRRDSRLPVSVILRARRPGAPGELTLKEGSVEVTLQLTKVQFVVMSILAVVWIKKDHNDLHVGAIDGQELSQRCGRELGDSLYTCENAYCAVRATRKAIAETPDLDRLPTAAGLMAEEFAKKLVAHGTAGYHLSAESVELAHDGRQWVP